jgi:integrative and conjugative element protein (TIGR02256 family)
VAAGNAGTPQRLPPVRVGVSVFLDSRAREALEREAARRRLRETGGALFGYDTGEDVVIACAYGPGPRARHRRSSFEADYGTTDALMRAVRHASRQRYRFLGSWHTHPGGAAIPSSFDTHTAAEIAGEDDVLLARPLVLIQATSPKRRGAEIAELAAWRWSQDGERLVREPLEPLELGERSCPVVSLPGRWPGSEISG